MLQASAELKNRLSWWGLKAKEATDPWVRFVLYWMIFDGYLTEMSNSGSDEEKFKWFFENNNDVKSLIPGCWGVGLTQYVDVSIKTLLGLSPIKDMRPNKQKSVSFKNKDSVEEIIRFIYQIRCNLFHGAKDIHDPKDDALVLYSGKLMKTLIDRWLI